jgi:ferritin-like metal-binding protein YciE
MKLENLHDLLVHELKDLYSAEKQLTRALPKMAKAACSAQLKEAFTNHLAETEEHVSRLERIFETLDVSTRGAKCPAMEGLIKEGSETMKVDMDEAVMDAALIAAAQRVEHYEIAAYGCARAFADQLGENDISGILQQTLDEESAANESLTDIAENEVNQQAMHTAAAGR